MKSRLVLSIFTLAFFLKSAAQDPQTFGNTKIMASDAAWAEGIVIVKPVGWSGLRLARIDPTAGNYNGNWAIGYNAATGNDFSISHDHLGTQYHGLFHISSTTRNVGIGTTNPGSKLTVFQTGSYGTNPLTASFGMGLTLTSFQRGVGHNAPVLITGVTNVYNDGAGGLLQLATSYTTEVSGIDIGAVEFMQPTSGKANSNASSKTIIVSKAVGSGGSVGGYGGKILFGVRPDNSNLSPWENYVMSINGDRTVVVDGTMISEEVKVKVVSAPDYVFSPDYDLRTLEETKAFIAENHHLPEIPSANEMEANGVSLGEMNMLLLKKIEELTLHLIEQNDLITELQKQNEINDQQSMEIAVLKEELKKLTIKSNEE